MSREATAYGRFQVPEAPSALRAIHWHRGGKLRSVDHEPKVGVLDQEDLIAQGIDTSKLIPGAKKVNALGSCTANATTAALSNLLSEAEFLKLTGCSSYDDVVTAEEWAIGFYHRCTDQTGQPAQEWPPTDCGSSGPYIVEELQTEKLASGAQIAHGARNIVSLMQTDGLLIGSPFLNAWEEPSANGFIDGNGTLAELERAISLGVAGGHETYWSAIEKIAFDNLGRVDPFGTIIRGRNSWTKSWGDAGSYYCHLSTFVALGQYCDWRQLQAA